MRVTFRLFSPSFAFASAGSTKRRAHADALKAGAKLSITREGFVPQIEPNCAAYLNDLRAAGVPEN